MAPASRILLVCGSLRSGSTNAAMLATAAAVAPPGVDAVPFEGMGELPHFNPDDDFDPLPERVVRLRAEIDRSAAVLFCTPEYAGALPGSFKNMLEWTVGGPEMYRRPAGWVNVAGAGRGEATHEQLRAVLGYIHADLVEGACTRIPLDRSLVGADGLVHDPGIRERLTAVLVALADHAARNPRESY